MIDLQKKGSIYLITMNDGENRWNTTFVRKFSKALDEVEKGSGPGALNNYFKRLKVFFKWP